jgi:hypothetical protein
MTVEIQIGDQAKTISPLKPTGRISVNGITMDATSEGTWIDLGADVVIVGGNKRRAIVREAGGADGQLRNHGSPLPAERQFETTPLQSPPAWVERIRSVKFGLVIGIVLIPIVWLCGIPFTIYALMLPVSGAIAGWLFGIFVATAIESVGPREDHRPRARGIAAFILFCCLIGAVVGLNMGGYLGIGCGLPLGALVGGMLVYVGMLLSFAI